MERKCLETRGFPGPFSLSQKSRLRSVALLIFLSAAAGAWIIAANSHWGTCTSSLCANGSAPMSILAALACGCTVSARGSGNGTIIRIALGLTNGSGQIIGIGAQFARRLALWCRVLDANGDFSMQELEQLVDDMVLDSCLQFFKHTEGFILELDQRVAVTNRTEMYAGAHYIQCVNVIPLLPVDD